MGFKYLQLLFEDLQFFFILRFTMLNHCHVCIYTCVLCEIELFMLVLEFLLLRSRNRRLENRIRVCARALRATEMRKTAAELLYKENKWAGYSYKVLYYYQTDPSPLLKSDLHVRLQCKITQYYMRHDCGQIFDPKPRTSADRSWFFPQRSISHKGNLTKGINRALGECTGHGGESSTKQVN